MNNSSLNRVFSSHSMRRRYEVWFLKLCLTDGSGAWWFRYLVMNLGRKDGGGCRDNPQAKPLQVWASWFPKDDKPQSFIRGFAQDGLQLSQPGEKLNLSFGDNHIDENSCAGDIEVDGHRISWQLNYSSHFGATMSDAGWIGFSRTPHSDAIFSGEISFDGRAFKGDLLGYGLQGHNCGYRHRNRWNWTHCLATGQDGGTSALEVLQYDIGLGLWFRKAILWHEGKVRIFRKFFDERIDRDDLGWNFKCSNPRDGSFVAAEIDGGGPSHHRLPYVKTDCSGSFSVSNNSLARARIHFSRDGSAAREIIVNSGAVIEMGGR